MLFPPRITNTIIVTIIPTTNTMTISPPSTSLHHHHHNRRHQHRHRHHHYDHFRHPIITIVNAIFTTVTIRQSLIVRPGFPCSSVSKESACNARDLGLIPGSGRSPGEGNGSPLQYSSLENLSNLLWIEPASPALAGRFFAVEPPRKRPLNSSQTAQPAEGSGLLG